MVDKLGLGGGGVDSSLVSGLGKLDLGGIGADNFLLRIHLSVA